MKSGQGLGTSLLVYFVSTFSPRLFYEGLLRIHNLALHKKFHFPRRNLYESFDFFFSPLKFSFLPEELQLDTEGMDPDMEEEFEAFIDEIEEHLLMQDFDPDIPNNVPDS